jgi:Tfp pilus assembly protein FimT
MAKVEVPEPIKQLQTVFTPVELLMTIFIAAILIGLAFSKFTDWRSKARDNERRHDMATIQYQVARHYALHGNYPRSLAEIKDLAAEACQAPRGQGSCSKPDYGYIAFREDIKPAIDRRSNCNNKTFDCAGYIIYTQAMEKANNPYSLSSY